MEEQACHKHKEMSPLLICESESRWRGSGGENRPIAGQKWRENDENERK